MAPYKPPRDNPEHEGGKEMIESPAEARPHATRSARLRPAGQSEHELGQAPIGRRLNVNVALDVGDAIDKLAKRHETTITDVVRRAVSTYKFIDDEVAAGGKILIERGGTIREVKFL
jgi:hypothetical protein